MSQHGFSVKMKISTFVTLHMKGAKGGKGRAKFASYADIVEQRMNQYFPGISDAWLTLEEWKEKLLEARKIEYDTGNEIRRIRNNEPAYQFALKNLNS